MELSLLPLQVFVVTSADTYLQKLAHTTIFPLLLTISFATSLMFSSPYKPSPQYHFRVILFQHHDLFEGTAELDLLSLLCPAGTSGIHITAVHGWECCTLAIGNRNADTKC